ncbi:glycosyltransferase family A protein [Cereibacter sp. SYSU M97828]|nr:glycosyltransferase family A protein [Cereibacter flavus]
MRPFTDNTPEPALARASIVIPVYNRERMLADCLNSLQPALMAGAEVIVVDDGSTDGSREAAARFRDGLAPNLAARMQLVAQENGGPGAARNTGVASSTRDWIVFVDSDDLWLPWSAETLGDTLAAAGDAVAVFFSTRGFSGTVPGWIRTAPRTSSHPGFFPMRDQMNGLIGSGYFAIRRATFDRLGGFLPKILGGEDTDLFYRLDGQGKVVAIHEPVMVAAREDNADSLTKSMKAVAQGLALLLKRQRAGSYPSPAARPALADALQFWLRSLCNEGYGRTAFTLLAQGGLGVLLAEGRYSAVAKLLLHPALSLIRPANYKFGWGPRLVS